MDTNDELNVIVKNTRKQIAGFLNEPSWVTASFRERVLSLNAEIALKKTAGHSHSVAQLVNHMSAWRNFVVQKLSGNNLFDISDDEEDWPSSTDWEQVIQRFESVDESLLQAIDHFSADRWHEVVPGRKYSFLHLLNGIVQHDFYHYGQIAVLLAAFNKTK